MASYVQDLSGLVGQHVEGVPSDIKQEFCKVWPDVKKGIQLLETVIKVIRPLAFLIPILETVNVVGDAVHNAMCH